MTVDPSAITRLRRPTSARIGAAAVALLLALAWPAIGPTRAQDAAAPDMTIDRAHAQAIVGNLRRITGDDGIEELRAVSIGGAEQWISVRGRDRDNPVLLFLHGGPAVPEMPGSWFYQTPWEDYFTVVQWDQRGSGKTLAASDSAAPASEMRIDRFVSDAEKLVAYLRETYGKRKIFVLGHSWGSVIGLKLALRRPEWLHAYIGMGQAIDFVENERIGTAFALREAEARGNAEALRELRAILPYPEPGTPLAIEKILLQRKWLTYFGGLTWGRHDLSFQEDAALLSPDYSEADIAARSNVGATQLAILPELAQLSFTDATQVDCPVFLLAGEHDYATSSELAAQWLDRLHAPEKHLIRFPGVAHEIQFEAPGRLFFHLVNDIRPIAVRAGDGAPAE
ncbi:alpha/beta fold hydrolase [Stakelama tenebrarum]|uniref:Alpha/beta hydrolase n=1 Tax=Stakelama tenebrarum TaxID=2711215 RepID=A0A6G6Y386_9SPHN|nr:alpha/beta hydrolase [Sphingosinithalassobacter tenebrarum]QIG79385.1 alpha/beta hydrolase [Sphingosinithalassobacter tenebrarum]